MPTPGRIARQNGAVDVRPHVDATPDAPLIDRIHDRSMALRIALVGAGIASLAIGLIGIVVPLLPTTPFVILAAACFARSSTRFHRWILANRVFGPTIREWETHRAIPRRTKIIAITAMLLTIGSSIVLFIDPPWARISAAALGVVLAVRLARIPSRTPAVFDG